MYLPINLSSHLSRNIINKSIHKYLYYIFLSTHPNIYLYIIYIYIISAIYPPIYKKSFVYLTIYHRVGGVSLQQRRDITSKMHGGKYLKAEIVRKKGIVICMYLQPIKFE